MKITLVFIMFYICLKFSQNLYVYINSYQIQSISIICYILRLFETKLDIIYFTTMSYSLL